MYRRDIYWHALPFNGQLEFFDVSLLEFAVQMTHEIDVKFGLPPKRTMSQVIPNETSCLAWYVFGANIDTCLDSRLDQELSSVCRSTVRIVQVPDVYVQMLYMVLHMHSIA